MISSDGGDCCFHEYSAWLIHAHWDVEVIIRGQIRGGGGGAGAGSLSPMETGATRAQRRQFSFLFAEYLRPGSIFALKKLYMRLPACECVHLIRKGALFAHDDALLGRWLERRPTASLPPVEATSWREKAPFRP